MQYNFLTSQIRLLHVTQQEVCYEKWCPGAQPDFSKILFNYRWLEVIENMEVVLKAVPFASCPQLSQDASEGNVPTLQGSSLIIN